MYLSKNDPLTYQKKKQTKQNTKLVYKYKYSEPGNEALIFLNFNNDEYIQRSSIGYLPSQHNTFNAVFDHTKPFIPSTSQFMGSSSKKKKKTTGVNDSDAAKIGDDPSNVELPLLPYQHPYIPSQSYINRYAGSSNSSKSKANDKKNDSNKTSSSSRSNKRNKNDSKNNDKNKTENIVYNGSMNDLLELQNKNKNNNGSSGSISSKNGTISCEVENAIRENFMMLPARYANKNGEFYVAPKRKGTDNNNHINNNNRFKLLGDFDSVLTMRQRFLVASFKAQQEIQHVLSKLSK